VCVSLAEAEQIAKGRGRMTFRAIDELKHHSLGGMLLAQQAQGPA
jgi:hypothetical protein